MAIDPIIEAGFGPVPSTIDLSESTVSSDNAAVIVLLILATLAIVLRFYARIKMRNSLGMDDWFVLAALAFVAGTVSMSIAGGSSGAGKHVWAITIDDLAAIFKILYIYTFLYGGACAMTKLSILFFYVRIFSFHDAIFRTCVIIGFALSVAYPITIWITMGLACLPVSYFWLQFSGAAGTCIQINPFFQWLAAINMVLDIYVLVLPIPKIFGLNMTLRKKAAVAGVMLLGGFVCIASVFRIFYLRQFAEAVDVTWVMGPVFIWSTIEPSFAIVGACLPSLAPLMNRFLENVSANGSARKRRHGYVGDSGLGYEGKQKRSTRHRLPDERTDDEIGLTAWNGNLPIQKNARNHAVSVPAEAGGSDGDSAVSAPPSQGILVKSSFVTTVA